MPITAPRAPRETLTITQMSRQFGTTPRALRYYEEKGLLCPRRKDHARIYSHREKVRLQLILQARRAGFTLGEVRGLFEVYDKQGRGAQAARALPLFKARLAALKLKRLEIADALELLKSASEQMAVKLGVITPDPSAAGRAAAPSTRRQPLRDLAPPARRHG